MGKYLLKDLLSGYATINNRDCEAEMLREAVDGLFDQEGRYTREVRKALGCASMFRNDF